MRYSFVMLAGGLAAFLSHDSLAVEGTGSAPFQGRKLIGGKSGVRKPPVTVVAPPPAPNPPPSVAETAPFPHTMRHFGVIDRSVPPRRIDP